MRYLLIIGFIIQLNILKLSAQAGSPCVGSLEFLTSDDAVHLPVSSGMQYYSSNGFTWECWIKLTTLFSSYSSTLLRPIICSIDPVPFEDIFLSFGWSGGVGNVASTHLCFKVDGPNSSTGASSASCDYFPAGGFVLGTWYHVAATMDYINHVSKLYLNGVLVDTRTVNSAPMTRVIPSQLSWDVAINPGYSNPPLGGNMDEVRIWTRVRTPAEIAAYYNQCLAGNEQDLLVYYRCNQSTGNTALDATTNALNGSLVNGAGWSLQQPVLIGSNCTIGCCPAFAVNNDTTICPGVPTQLNCSGGFTSYSWTPSTALSNSSIQNPVASPTVTTNYIVTATYVDAVTQQVCTSKDSIKVVVNNPLTLTLPGYTVCVGQSVMIVPVVSGGTGNYSYDWGNGFTGSVYVTTPTADSVYTVKATDITGCSVGFSTGTITVLPPLNVNVIGISICTADSVTLTANASGGSGSYSYTWTPSNSHKNPLVVLASSGSMVYTVLVSDGCSVNNVSDTATVNILNTPIVTLFNYTVCAGQSVNIVPGVTGGSGVYNYNWGNGYTNATYSTTPKADSLYSVIVTDANGCVAPVTNGSITVLVPLTVNATGTSICIPDTAKLLAVASGGDGNYIFNWSPTNSNQNPLVVNPQTTTIYSVTVSDGCSTTTDTAGVVVAPAPTIGLPPPVSGCKPVCINLNNIPYNTLSNWQWNFGDNSNSGIVEPFHCYTNAGNYNISLTYTTTLGCTKTVASNNIVTVFPFPHADFSASTFDTDIFNTDINFYNESSGYNSSQWDFGDLTGSSAQNPSHLYSSINNYYVTLIVKNSKGCTDTAVRELMIHDIFTFYAPNSFSPNNDQRNDVFLPTGTGWDNSSFKLWIFDRWGNLILTTADPYKGWDGIKKDEIMQEDTYVWKVELKDVFGKGHFYSGAISLLK